MISTAVAAVARIEHSEGDAEMELAAAARLGPHSDEAAMQLYDLLAQREPQARLLTLPGLLLNEVIEEFVLVLLGDAGSLVPHTHSDGHPLLLMLL